MSPAAAELLPAERDSTARVAYSDRDYPFYNGKPTLLSGGQWLIVLIGVAAGIGAMMLPVPFLSSKYGQFIPAVLFPGFPLAALGLVAGRYWRALFAKIGWRDIALMLGFGFLNVAITIGVSYAAMNLFNHSANPAVTGLADLPRDEIVLFFVRTIAGLLGEEILTILPFLAVMTFACSRLNIRRGVAIVIAWIASALLFGAAHLPTYDWNLVQAFGIIGLAQLILTLPYMVTKNIWVSTGAHIVNDWTLFAIALGGLRLATG